MPGGVLALRRWGAAPDGGACFLLLHGFAGALGTWNGVAAALAAQGGTVFVPDLPGHGDTTLDAATPEAIARALLGALDHVPGGIGRPHLVGHSMGAAVALLMAATEAARFASLSLISPIGLSEQLRGDFLAAVLAARDADTLARALSPLTARPMPQDGAGLAALLAALDRHRATLTALAATLADGNRQRLDLRATLAALRLPARVLAGRRDAVLRWERLALPPHVPLHLLDCGHMPHWEQPGAVRRVLAQTDWHAVAQGGWQ